MPATASSKKSRRPTLPPTVAEYLDKTTDPYELASQLDENAEFIQQYTQLYDQIFRAEATRTDQAVKTLIDELDDCLAVELAARQAGFILGFEYCRRLLGRQASAR